MALNESGSLIDLSFSNDADLERRRSNSAEFTHIPKAPAINQHSSSWPSGIGTKKDEKSQRSSTVYDPVLFDIMEIPPKKFAKQITLVDFSYFKKIEREELESLGWTGGDKWKKAPNVTTCIHRFNNLTLWVSHEILNSTNVKRRAEKIEHFISIAKYCLEFNNFNGLKCILGGLESSPIHRLTKTWALVGRLKNTFEDLCTLMNSDNNSENYRKRYAKIKAPAIPYLGIHLSDLIYGIEARSKVQNKSNLNKTVDQILNEILKVKETSFSFTEIKAAIEFLNSPKFISEFEYFFEDDNYKLSLQLEPESDENKFDSSNLVLRPKRFSYRRTDSIKSKESIPEDLEQFLDEDFDNSLPVPSPMKSPKKNYLHDDDDSERSLTEDEIHPNGGAPPSKFFTSSNRESLEDSIVYQGFLIRKEVTTGYKRSSNRSWKRFFVILRHQGLMLYKEKHGKQSFTQSPLFQIEITQESFANVATDYKKRKNVFKFLPVPGTEILFEAEDEASLREWVAGIETVTQKKRNPNGNLISFT